MGIAVSLRAEGRPELAISLRNELETLRENTNDGVRCPAQRNSLARDILPASKPFLPSGVAQYCGLRRREIVFPFVKIPAKNWSDSEGSKETGADLHSDDRLASGCGAEQISVLVIGIEGRENLI